jgi:hypothetical protein
MGCITDISSVANVVGVQLAESIGTIVERVADEKKRNDFEGVLRTMLMVNEEDYGMGYLFSSLEYQDMHGSRKLKYDRDDHDLNALLAVCILCPEPMINMDAVAFVERYTMKKKESLPFGQGKEEYHMAA